MSVQPSWIRILLLTVLVFRSLLYGVFSLVPLGAGLLLNFAFMAITRIPLDMTTIMVANIGIGVGVDSAIYLVIQYRRELALSPADYTAAIQRTLVVMGPPILLASLSMAAGPEDDERQSFFPVQGEKVLLRLDFHAVVGNVRRGPPRGILGDVVRARTVPGHDFQSHRFAARHLLSLAGAQQDNGSQANEHETSGKRSAHFLPYSAVPFKGT